MSTPFLFDGAYLDQATGLYKMGARYYDPSVGRWTQMDPVLGWLPNPQSLNPYLFVGNNPVSLTDPTGYVCWRYFGWAMFWLFLFFLFFAIAFANLDIGDVIGFIIFITLALIAWEAFLYNWNQFWYGWCW